MTELILNRVNVCVFLTFYIISLFMFANFINYLCEKYGYLKKTWIPDILKDCTDESTK